MPLSLQTFSTTEDANAALKTAGTRYLGGGTLLVRAANEGNLSFSTLVRATDPALGRIQVSDNKVRIGASVTMAQVARHPALAMLAGAACAVGGPAVHNMATVGGNLFARAPYGDFAVALLALDAVVHTGDKATPIEAFLRQRETSAIVTAVSLTLPTPDSFRFLKVSRVKPKGVAVLSLAAVIEEGADGAIGSACIALGCMADRPIRAHAAEQALIGQKRTKDGIAPALAVAAQSTAPITDAVASAWYRAEVLPVHLGRLLLS